VGEGEEDEEEELEGGDIDFETLDALERVRGGGGLRAPCPGGGMFSMAEALHRRTGADSSVP
jgi:hypothetical protein